jgi:hypothetical protein
MRTTSMFRALLWLYPSEFRKQFSSEMISVFEQRAGERFAEKGTVSVAFLVTEFFAIVKGANMMWFSKILPFRRESSGAQVQATQLSLEEAVNLRKLAIEKMVAAIADHDFIAARRYSDEEARLKGVVEHLEQPATAQRRLA